MRCSTCHSDQNVDLVPGAPHWGLAPLAMAWEGLDDAQLADAIKDPKRNGNRTLGAALRPHGQRQAGGLGLGARRRAAAAADLARRVRPPGGRVDRLWRRHPQARRHLPPSPSKP